MKKAFTLIELLVVVLIVGILTAIALPQYKKAVLKSRAAKGIIRLQTMTQAQKVYWMENGKFARDTNELGISNTGSCYEDSGSGVYCSVGGKNVYFEWQGRDQTGRYFWVCYAGNTDTIAKELCQQYQASWGGSGSSVNGNHTYYFGKGQS